MKHGKKWSTKAGWWYTYPSEKNESQLGWWHSWKNKKCSKPPMKYEIQLEQSLESGSFRKDLEETHHSWWYHVKNMVSSSLFFSSTNPMNWERVGYIKWVRSSTWANEHPQQPATVELVYKPAGWTGHTDPLGSVSSHDRLLASGTQWNPQGKCYIAMEHGPFIDDLHTNKDGDLPLHKLSVY